LEELHERLKADRQALEEREANLARCEQTLAALQEQVRRRSEETIERVRQAAEHEKELDEQAQQAAEAHRAAEEQFAAARKELDERAAGLTEAQGDLVRREEALRVEAVRVDETNLGIAGQRQALAAERTAWEVERQTAAETAGRAKAALE